MKYQSFKKNTFVGGAFVATLAIIITKVLGILYVIPFYSIIGEEGGALYGYAYNIYTLFLGIACGGIPFAISKIVSEYNELGYYTAKEKMFKLSKMILLLLGFISFIIVFVFSKPLATILATNITGTITIKNIAFAIRMISVSLIIVPLLSVYRGYLQGHKYITTISISQVLEQVVRVLVIIIGSLYMIKVFKLDVNTTIGYSLLATFIGALLSYFYLLTKTLRNKKIINKKILKVEEPKITSKQIIRKIIFYALPFAMVDVFKSLYDLIDIFLLPNILINKYHYSINDVNKIISVFTTWGAKLNMIILSISSGILVSFIPNLSSAVAKKDYEDINRKINKAIVILLYFIIPMTFGLSILAKPLWLTFYKTSQYGPSVFSFFVFIALFSALFSALQITLQILKEYKMLFKILIVSFLTNLIFTIPFTISFAKMGFKPYFGAIFATIVGLLIAIIITLIYLHKKYKVKFHDTLIKIVKIFYNTLIMAIVLLLLQLLIPFNKDSRTINIIYLGLYSILGTITYLYLTYKNGLIKEIYGDNLKKLKVRR